MKTYIGPDGTQYTARLLCAHLYVSSGGKIKIHHEHADVDVQLAKLGYMAKDCPVSMWRRLKYRFKKFMRKMLLGIGGLEVHFR